MFYLLRETVHQYFHLVLRQWSHSEKFTLSIDMFSMTSLRLKETVKITSVMTFYIVFSQFRLIFNQITQCKNPKTKTSSFIHHTSIFTLPQYKQWRPRAKFLQFLVGPKCHWWFTWLLFAPNLKRIEIHQYLLADWPTMFSTLMKTRQCQSFF